MVNTVGTVSTVSRPSCRGRGQNGFMRVRGIVVRIVVHKHTASRVVWAHAPRKFLYFRLSEITSDEFSSTILTSTAKCTIISNNHSIDYAD